MGYNLNDLEKDRYEKVEMEIIDLENEDIITTSDPSYPGEPDPVEDEED
jgi:hypothetical protein